MELGTVIYSRTTIATAFIAGEILIQIGSSEGWLCVAIEPVHMSVFGVDRSPQRDILEAESFLRSLVKNNANRIVCSDAHY